jgi:hypothetical protein
MNLTQRPPRSPRIRLGGYVLLPRLIDKCRAVLADTNGEYHYDCPLDQRFLNFTGINADDLKKVIEENQGDGAVLAWVEKNAPLQHDDWQIAQWSAFRESMAPSDNESREFFNEQVAGAGGAEREDISTWFDYIDLDDYASFGGKA